MEKTPTHKAVEIIENKLFWISDDAPPKSQSAKALYFCVDENLVYIPFYKDFGPLNLAYVHIFCSELNSIVANSKYKKSKIYHYTSKNYAKRANAAFLMGCYLILFHQKTAEESWKFFKNVEPAFKPFVHATQGQSDYQCTILECLQGFELGIQLGWYDKDKFDSKTYLEKERVENGDMNWIVPDMFLAFSSPSAAKYDEDGVYF